MKTELEKFYAGEEFNLNDPEISKLKANCRRECEKFNFMAEDHAAERIQVIRDLFGTAHDDTMVKPPFHCDYGFNIHVGRNFLANFDTVMLDTAPITIGDNCLIGPQCGFYAAVHPKNAEKRMSNVMWGEPITVGDNVWFGGHCTVLPGVTIGNNVIVGAGSVVTKDIPDDMIVAGNPAKVIGRNEG